VRTCAAVTDARIGTTSRPITLCARRAVAYHGARKYETAPDHASARPVASHAARRWLFPTLQASRGAPAPTPTVECPRSTSITVAARKNVEKIEHVLILGKDLIVVEVNVIAGRLRAVPSGEDMKEVHNVLILREDAVAIEINAVTGGRNDRRQQQIEKLAVIELASGGLGPLRMTTRFMDAITYRRCSYAPAAITKSSGTRGLLTIGSI